MPTRVVVRAPEPPEPPQSAPPPKANSRSRGIKFSDDVGGSNEDEYDEQMIRSASTDLSRYDISASRQLENYFICFASSIVDLVSYNAQKKGDDAYHDMFVLDWKEWGSYVLGVIGTSMTGVIMLVHFDKFFCPGFWMSVFRGGSMSELFVALFIFTFYCGNAYINTSPYSLGEIVPNVYFSSWVALASSAKLVDRWIKNTGRKSIFERLTQHNRKTTMYWSLLVVFSSISFFAGLEIYLRRNKGVNYFGIDAHNDISWHILLPLSGSSVAIAVIGLVGNFYGAEKFQIKLLCCTLDLGWRRFESTLLLCELGIYSFGVFRYIGTQNFFNRPSNPYFGIWGSLLSSILAVAASIKEHNFSLVSYSKEEGLRFLTCAETADD